jgi:hypothetical protein
MGATDSQAVALGRQRGQPLLKVEEPGLPTHPILPQLPARESGQAPKGRVFRGVQLTASIAISFAAGDPEDDEHDTIGGREQQQARGCPGQELPRGAGADQKVNIDYRCLVLRSLSNCNPTFLM